VHRLLRQYVTVIANCMMTCKKCNSGRLKRIDIYKFHEVYECVNCYALTSTYIKDCICKDSYPVVVQEHLEFGNSRLFYQCPKCGFADRTKLLAKKANSEKIEHEFDQLLFDERKISLTNERAEINERFNFYRQSKYYDYQRYLLSDPWKELRAQVFARDKGICLYCKTNTAEQVHHKHYLTLYKESVDDLESVCASCHHDIHKSVFASV
jgi:5-methylcytosine-specific restriction endonuclease McrA